MHRFTEIPSQRALRHFIIGAKKEAEERCRDKGVDLPVHECAYVWKGDKLNMTDLMATQRRVSVKSAAPLLPLRRAAGAGSSRDLAPDDVEEEREEPLVKAPLADKLDKHDKAGFVWLVAEHSVLGDLGSEVASKLVSSAQGDKGIAKLSKGNFSENVFVRQVAVEDAHDFVEKLKDGWRKLLEGDASLPLSKGTATPEVADDARTLPVKFDEHGERWRDWRVTVGKSEENFYEDWLLEGPKTVLWLMKHVDRTGGAPMAWFQRFLTESRISATDRSAYELQTLARIFELGACYDQLNLPSLACFEVLSRRWQLLLDAISRDPGDPKFEDEELWAGQSQRSFGIAPQLTAHVATKTKEKADVEKQRQKAKELRALAKAPAKK